MRKQGLKRVLVLAFALGLVAAACGDDGDDDGGGASGGSAPEGSLRVPQDHDTIQEAVDAAQPGDLVYVDTGTYNESVTVTTENIVIRGADRNETIVDGQFEEENCIFVVETNGVAVENLTTQNCTNNGVFFTGVDGYRASYVNAIRNGAYGIYAFDSTNGQFDHSYAAGSADGGFYIGQCNPCNAVISDVESEWNGLGYSGTNASGNLHIVSSSWHDNRVGVVPNSLTSEELYPQGDIVIAGNTVYENNNDESAAVSIAQTAIGNGILVAGGNDNVVEKNLVEDHDISGIAVIPLPETLLYEDREGAMDFNSTGNSVIDNVVTGSGRWDLGLVPSLEAANTGDNCFSGNEAALTGPPDLQTLLPCDAEGSGTFEAPIDEFAEIMLADKPDAIGYQDAELPDYEGENMPDADSAPAEPPTSDNVPMTVDVAAITTPTSRT